jgi:hypothetical protein
MAFLKIDSSSVGTYSSNKELINSDIGSESGIGILISSTGNSSYAPTEFSIGDIDGNGHYGIKFQSGDRIQAAAGVTTSLVYKNTNATNVSSYYYCIEFDVRVIPDPVKHTAQSGNVFVCGGSDYYNGFKVYFSTTNSVRTFTFHQMFELESGVWHHIKLQAVSGYYSTQVWNVYCDGEYKGQTIQGFSTGTPSICSCSLSNSSGTYADGGTKIDIANFELSLIPNAVEQRPCTSAAGTYQNDVLSAVANVDIDSRTVSVSNVWRDESQQISDNTNASIESDGVYYIIATDSNNYTNIKEIDVKWGYAEFYIFPHFPLQSSYQITHQPNVIRTEMFDKHFRQRYSDVVKYSELSCRFLMVQSELDTWIEQWRSTLHEGADWFFMNTLEGVKEVRLKNGEFEYSLNHRSEDKTLWEVTFKVEVKE